MQWQFISNEDVMGKSVAKEAVQEQMGIGQSSGNELVAAVGMAGCPAHPRGCGKGQAECEPGITLSL